MRGRGVVAIGDDAVEDVGGRGGTDVHRGEVCL